MIVRTGLMRHRGGSSRYLEVKYNGINTKNGQTRRGQRVCPLRSVRSVILCRRGPGNFLDHLGSIPISGFDGDVGLSDHSAAPAAFVDDGVVSAGFDSVELDFVSDESDLAAGLDSAFDDRSPWRA